VDPYSTQAWNEFFVAGAGAAAALTGLVFVALSINLTRILALEGLPARAAGALAILTPALILCLLGLVPQATDALSGEILVVAIVGGFAALRTLNRATPGEGPTRSQSLAQAVIVC
jgi:drug/metabolite transporter (DMT)-like permease